MLGTAEAPVTTATLPANRPGRSAASIAHPPSIHLAGAVMLPVSFLWLRPVVGPVVGLRG